MSLIIWAHNKSIEIRTNLTEPVKKLANINNHLYLLTYSNTLYKGQVEGEEEKHADFQSIPNFAPIDIDSYKDTLFIIDPSGAVLVCDENLTVLKQIHLLEAIQCPLGHNATGHKVKIKSLAIGGFGAIYVSECNQLWGSGHMPHIGIDSDVPKKVEFFSQRVVHNIAIGTDFAVIVVSKQTFNEPEPVAVLCQHCFPLPIEHAETGQPENLCPLGVKLEDLSVDESDVSTEVNGTLVEEEKVKLEKNIIFRNTEAAKDFLTRQISRMSSAGEEYLIECTEKPTRIIKENMTNVATFVYEGVKTVGDKVATLSRHVSLGSDYTSVFDNEPGTNRRNSKDDFLLSLSQSTSERDFQDLETEANTDLVLLKGSDILDREVWMWGNSRHGCEGINTPNDQLPIIISTLSRQGVSKVSLQEGHACAVTIDGRAFLWGRNDDHQVTFESKSTQIVPKAFVSNINERVLDAACGIDSTTILSNKTNVTYFGKLSQSYQTIYHKFMAEGVNNWGLKPFSHLISSNEYCLLNLVAQCDETLNQFIVKEQVMLEEMIVVDKMVMKLLSKKALESDNATLCDTLCSTYKQLLHFLAVNVETLLEHRSGLIPIEGVTLIKHCKEFVTVYKSYVEVVQDFISIDGFDHLATLVTVDPQLYTLRSGVLKEPITKDKEVQCLVQSPIKRLLAYSEFYRKFGGIDALFKWRDLLEFVDSKNKEAERTGSFWQIAGKTVDYLKLPKRRLICDSPINLLNSSRFSTHRFILFSDVFVHISNSTHHAHDLGMLWLELPHNDSLHLITLKTPEETLTLVTPDGVSKMTWYHALQQAIKAVLNKSDLHQPPLARKGTHTFSKAGPFKEATYTGRWFNAKIHGSGKLVWPDGRTYTGQFVHNCMSGYGVMDIPNVGTYEGEWKDNKQDGYGVYTYSNHDIYKGYFKEGARHGHGLLRKGNFTTNSASLYIGEWTGGKKSGYGVLDDIATGEKYLGHWSDCKREGSGVIITSEGTYYEGNFHNDSLYGRGIMVLDEGLHYEGEFKGTGILGGKGMVNLPSGHTLEGSLSGSLEEGIKINSGVLHKRRQDANAALPKSFGKFCTPPSEKWQALFKHCHDILGLGDDVAKCSSSEAPRIWQNVAVYLTSASTLKKSKAEEGGLLNSLNNLDVIPPFGRENVTVESYAEIKTYLCRAFDSSYHPLGSLLNNLSEAYISSYSGKVHPILVNHAISEIIDITRRVYDVVRYLFPALPDRDSECLLTNAENETEIVSYQSLLYPVILPKVYNCLCTLLSLKNETQEKQYKKVLIEWNKLSDRSLMGVLSVEKKFFDLDQYISLSDKSSAFVEAIETLQQIITLFLPIEKLAVIRSTVEKMTPVARDLLGGGYVWNMDDLFPLFLYVVVRARIPHLGAELEYMEYFMDRNLDNGELGIMFTTLKACYQQILQDKSLL